MLTPEQHEFRLTGLGGSDAASVLGLSPWKGPLELWLEKGGFQKYRNAEAEGEAKIARTDRESFAMACGSRLEATVAEFLMRGEDIRPHGPIATEMTSKGLSFGPGLEMVRHPEHEFMLANTDRTIPGGVGRTTPEGIVEIKTADPRVWWLGWRNGPPLHYQIQGQHYCAVTGADYVIFAVAEGNRCIHTYHMPRDDKFIDGRLIPALAKFWGLVQSGERPEADDSESTARALAVMYPEPEPKLSVELDEHVGALAAEYDACKASQREAAKHEKALKNQLLAAVEDAEIATFPDGASLHRVKSGKGFSLKYREPKEVYA